MGLSTKLEMRQGQQLVMTPQLQQAIRLLQLSNLELDRFVEEELERNPLLEREAPGGGADGAAVDERGGDAGAGDERAVDERSGDEGGSDGSGDASYEADGDGGDGLDLSVPSAEAALALDADAWCLSPDAGPADRADDGGDTRNGAGEGAGDGTGGLLYAEARQIGATFADGDIDLEAFVAAETTLHDHLAAQLALATSCPLQRLIGRQLIDHVDDTGYLTVDLADLAQRLGAPLATVEGALALVQTFDPPGVAARTLVECLRLQLQDQNRYDPMIAAVLERLDLLAARNMAALQRHVGCDHDDLSEMIAEIRRLDPKPGMRFASVPVAPVVPDVTVRLGSGGAWLIELNQDTLPRVLLDRSYVARVAKASQAAPDKAYLAECLQTANWLIRSLDQRARTILKVSEEIVRRQDAFLMHGVEHLRPLNLKTVADAIAMHESTVSRVTSNKYMATPRGIFELKYFFTSSIASATGDGEAHSSEAVRHRIKQMIDAEPAEAVLSDDRLVEKLKADGVDIARRTVAKYREALRIPSSVQRRREKMMNRRLARAEP